MAKRSAKTPAKQTPAKRSPRKPRASATGRLAPAKTEHPRPAVYSSPPPAPPQLVGDGLQLWERLTSELVQLRMLTHLDVDALRVLCDAWHQYLALADYADPAKAFFCTDKGYIVEHPGVRLRYQAGQTCERLWKKFGLTPLDRERLEVDLAGEDPDDIQAFARKR